MAEIPNLLVKVDVAEGKCECIDEGLPLGKNLQAVPQVFGWEVRAQTTCDLRRRQDVRLKRKAGIDFCLKNSERC